ncbi:MULTISPECIES: tRNA (uridine(34)/cytosine(34)/5-carboxymethylaminomethyluridine(34)-2'-O)-methyltransferase TrmL [unclassified Fusibacter]|uniref:tRNA (uridine(34)/cytosine(34)/5- carboxymethylaminomethyluridine(34)-2'-O)- methyltransferase TrmL n=1 Tax=unclassified Fusibacter TaxID=2624464 RepID=UPI0010124E67|nr:MULTISPECIES: tRNA (uridine(34)/cytosine(34)/5-carboxymethylaminomethyluridine(34)-2'-O)-methyltransferase TrmL [unclassified Fusibacter]MCK8059755.1 tRNA (uridine(34)/cytosine(34)/5-carboxymethylaminomethyluridine(34)-2'-O)-methyltransferase TrmL [Fusibacter sp. A2]NPE21556.1 tRNA (uridine(34)/cytosine(34)/5-carboxymethylaminomethyluridine(34)-2'-O)-methyltransferase TrmL [Fusibacter sp. A1]RXV61964.1 tRNA (uridine(34)/cytosine(34)/5-carboxymethylaminomethyluridine(34)-2'-O)-methyltransferas
MLNIVLYQPEIPPNTGNIARTCVITNTRLHLIKPLGFSIDDKSLKRAGLDYWELLDLVVYESIEEFLEKHGDKKIFFATTKATSYYSDVSYSDECFIMFGKETSGLPAWVHEQYEDKRIKLPMRNHELARSLNLSNAVNIILFEALRQLDFPHMK